MIFYQTAAESILLVMLHVFFLSGIACKSLFPYFIYSNNCIADSSCLVYLKGLNVKGFYLLPFSISLIFLLLSTLKTLMYIVWSKFPTTSEVKTLTLIVCLAQFSCRILVPEDVRNSL